MNASLDQELVAYKARGGELEEWQRLTLEVEHCRKIESTICAGIALLANIDRENNSWIRQVREQGVPFYWHRAGEIAMRYTYWKFITSIVLHAVGDCEKLKYVIEGAEELRAQYERVSGMSLDIESARVSMESETTVPHAEAMRVLRSRLQKSSA